MLTIGSGNYSGDLEDRLIASAGRSPVYEESQEGPSTGDTADTMPGNSDYSQRSTYPSSKG